MFFYFNICRYLVNKLSCVCVFGETTGNVRFTVPTLKVGNRYGQD